METSEYSAHGAGLHQLPALRRLLHFHCGISWSRSDPDQPDLLMAFASTAALALLRRRSRGVVSIGVSVTDQRKQTSCRLPAQKRVAHSKIVCSQRSACQIRPSRSGGDGGGELRRLRLIGYCHASVLIRPKRKKSSSLLLKRARSGLFGTKVPIVSSLLLERFLPTDASFFI